MPYLIAEIGLAHMGSVAKSCDLIYSAAEAGFDAVKFQVYKTDELIDWVGDPKRYARFAERELNYGEIASLKVITEDTGLDWLATPHTVGAFQFLDELGVDSFKVGSGDRGEILDLALASGKKVYVSTGLRDWDGVRQILRKCNGHDATILHCITQYPVTDENLNLGFLRTLAKHTNDFGYSDHYPGTFASAIATVMGAKVIEKHIMLPESKGQDCHGAVNKDELKQYVADIRNIDKLIGSEDRVYSKQERENEKWAFKGKNGKRPQMAF
ncbi:MAG: hypothetical protein GY861_02945 [bacterium]|nr:hypothetical protein [bacterium]